MPGTSTRSPTRSSAVAVDGGNDLLLERAEEIGKLRAQGKPTLPTTIAIERATNPFLRADEADLKAAMGMDGADGEDVFAALRERKSRA